MSEEAVRKRREREEKRAAAARATALVEGVAEEDVFTPPPSDPTPAGPETPSGIASSNAAWTVTIPASSSSLPWYSSEGQETTYATIDDARAAGIWTYPSTPFERAKCAVYRDLWEKGHYMGGGIRFGADFLVYPGTLSSFLFLPFRFSDRKLTVCLMIPRRPATISLALRRQRHRVSHVRHQTDGDRRSRQAGNCDEEGASFVWVGRGEGGGAVLFC